MTSPIDTAYILIKPKTDGVSAEIERAVDQPLEETGRTAQLVSESIRRNYDETAKELKLIFEETGSSIDRSMRDSAESVDRSTDEMKSHIKRDLDEVDTSSKRAGQNLSKNIESGTNGASSRVSSFVSGPLNTLRNGLLLAGGAAVTATGFIIGLGIKQAAANQNAQVSFDLLLNSHQKAMAFLGDIEKFAAATPFDLPTLKDAASRLLAVGVNAKDVIPIMTRLGDATAGMGTGAEGIERAVLALQQIKTGGVVHAGDILQLTEAGIPAWDALAAHFHTTVAKMRDEVSKGLIKPDALFAAIEQGEGPAFTRLSGMMMKQSATLSGMWSTFKDNVSQELASAFAPAIPTLSKLVNWAGTEVPKLIGEVESAFKSVFNFIKGSGLIDEVKSFAASFNFGSSVRAIRNDVMDFVKVVKQNWPEIKQMIGAVAIAIFAVVKVILTLIDWTIKLDAEAVKVWSRLTDGVVGFVHIALTYLGSFINGAAKAFGWVPGLGPKLRAAASDFNSFSDKVNAALNHMTKAYQIQVKIDVQESAQARRLMNTLKGASPGVQQRITVAGFAEGGHPRKGSLFWTGENGPELMGYDSTGALQVLNASQSKAYATREAPTASAGDINIDTLSIVVQGVASNAQARDIGKSAANGFMDRLNDPAFVAYRRPRTA